MQAAVQTVAATVQQQALAQLDRVIRGHSEQLRLLLSTENPASPLDCVGLAIVAYASGKEVAHHPSPLCVNAKAVGGWTITTAAAATTPLPDRPLVPVTFRDRSAVSLHQSPNVVRCEIAVSVADPHLGRRVGSGRRRRRDEVGWGQCR